MSEEPVKQKLELQHRGFKPVIPMAMPISQMSVPVLKQANIPIEAKVSELYERYLNLLKQNKLICVTIQHVNKQKNELKAKCLDLQSMEKSQTQQKKKRHRRNANQINRDYKCPIDGCDKSYGAQASLTQHIKLKHQNFYQSQQYERFLIDLTNHKKSESQ